MLDFDFMHVIESSIGLTIGSLSARAIGNACSRTCSKPDVQQIEKQEEDDEHDLSDNNSDISLSLIHISEPTRPLYISYAVFCLLFNLLNVWFRTSS